MNCSLANFLFLAISLSLRHKPESLVGKIQISEKVQKKIQDVVFKALEKDPKERYKNVKIFAEELEKACFGRIRKQRLSRKRLQELYQEIAQLIRTLVSIQMLSRLTSIRVLCFLSLGTMKRQWMPILRPFAPNTAVGAYYQLGNAYYNLGDLRRQWLPLMRQ